IDPKAEIERQRRATQREKENSFAAVAEQFIQRHAKHASTKRKRSIKAVPLLGAAGLSLSLVSAASAEIDQPAVHAQTPKDGMNHETTLCEEEISDVSLGTFYVFDKETVGTIRRTGRLAMGGCGGGCPCVGCGGCESSSSNYEVPTF